MEYLYIIDILFDLCVKFIESFSTLEMVQPKKIIYAGQPGSRYHPDFDPDKIEYFIPFPYRIYGIGHAAAWATLFTVLIGTGILYDKKKKELAAMNEGGESFLPKLEFYTKDDKVGIRLNFDSQEIINKPTNSNLPSTYIFGGQHISNGMEIEHNNIIHSLPLSTESISLPEDSITPGL